ncbi:hypothetical protein C0991_010415, partial [Blastosporella zonata]
MPGFTLRSPNKTAFDVKNPTRGEYTAEAAKEFLNVLQAVAQAVPIPGFGAAVKVAASIIKGCDDSHATLERAQELKIRIKKLVVVLVNEVKGKKADEIQSKILEDIKTLKEDMEYIKSRLNEIAAQNSLLVILFRNINEDKVRKCVARLDSSIESFGLAREIEQSDLLARLEQQISAFHAQQQETLDEIKGKMGSFQITMDDVKAILDKRLPEASSSEASRAIMPANVIIFHGRDSTVVNLVNIITGPRRQHICLLGPGGMGKTSTSLAVMEHGDVMARFPDHLRVWVPCVKATSMSLFLDTLHASLGVARKSGNTLNDIISELKGLPSPIVILLDNFETPWNADESEAEGVLRKLHQLPHIILFITMRSSTPPCGDLPWYHVDLRAVDAAAARDIYVSWHQEGSDDPDVPRLLALIGHMPLAVKLLARVAKVTHLSARELIEEYENKGTQLLGQGLDAEHSMDICIGLSVYSSRMRAHQNAFTLLCTLSMLPIGTSFKMLSKWWASDLPNLAGALEVLKSTSLVEERGNIFFILPVIQRYIRDPSRFPDAVRSSMIESACSYLAEHASSTFGDPEYKSHTKALSAESGNLEAVLLTATAPDLHIIRDGLLSLAYYQKTHQPRLDIIEHALKLASDPSFDDKILQGDLNLAIQAFKQAISLYLVMNNLKKLIECRLKLAEALRFMCSDFPTEQENILAAQEDCISIGDEPLAGRCLLAFGLLYWKYNRPSALSTLVEAETIFARFKDVYYHSRCCQALSWVYSRSGDYDSAHK